MTATTSHNMWTSRAGALAMYVDAPAAPWVASVQLRVSAQCNGNCAGTVFNAISLSAYKVRGYGYSRTFARRSHPRDRSLPTTRAIDPHMCRAGP